MIMDMQGTHDTIKDTESKHDCCE